MLPKFAAAFLAFLLAVPAAFAQGSTGPRPTYYYNGVPGGYQVAQPIGPNVSRHPLPVNRTGLFTAARPPVGGQHYTASAGSGPIRTFDQSGVFDVKPSPFSSNTGAVKVVAKIPTKNLLKAIGSALPFLGTAIAVADLAELLVDNANQSKPADDLDTYFYTPQDGIHALSAGYEWRGPFPGVYSSPGAACAAGSLHLQGLAGGYAHNIVITPVNATADCSVVVPAAAGNPSYVLQFSGIGGLLQALAKKPFDFDYFDSLPDSAFPPDSMIEPVANSIPQMDVPVPDVDLVPSVDTQPAPDVDVTTKSNGDTVTTTTTSNLNIVNNNIIVTTTTSVVTRSPDGTLIPTAPEDQPVAPPESQFSMPCGLPGTPPCEVRVDESGVSPASAAAGELSDEKTGFGQIATDFGDAITEAQNAEAPDWTWTFSLPTGCSPLPMGAFGFEVNICQFQPTIHDLMSLAWVAAGIFGLLGLLRSGLGGAA